MLFYIVNLSTVSYSTPFSAHDARGSSYGTGLRSMPRRVEGDHAENQRHEGCCSHQPRAAQYYFLKNAAWLQAYITLRFTNMIIMSVSDYKHRVINCCLHLKMRVKRFNAAIMLRRICDCCVKAVSVQYWLGLFYNII